MGNNAKTLIEQVRALPPQDRIALVEEVLDSLDRTDPGIDQLWAREARDRLAPIGAVSLRPKTWATLSPNTGRDGQVS
jgi:hypothetical protein